MYAFNKGEIYWAKYEKKKYQIRKHNCHCWQLKLRLTLTDKNKVHVVL